MAQKQSKGKGVASSIHGSKRSRRDNKEKNEDLNLPQKPLRVSLALEYPHIVDRLLTLILGFVFNDLGECNLNKWPEFDRAMVPPPTIQ
ncbi:hypothetical protein HAX54_000398, partial [Datura stramonium]|nr:hypothetical protein [Datura stramonium]